ncbi:flagellar biosynthesis protein FlhA [Enterobacter sp. RHB15-C17]|jgi:Flagellar biosynthesis pathway, component FlhA|uniref:Flagellar biosynthesis protein FlhA n=1 Tax=Lelliottia nimipressuralis TaxID=69220 RepID=A0ABD4KEA9_9ENTR|nr:MULTISPECIES: flagellar biosynthesis protein FlhA [Lelliottia]PKA29663.1 flagellar biosynthesis protein FlhA [Cedecea lapagei]QMM51213.1 flagellar biosynthesis protein FlhA [Enterobacter sp. RHB15-C17]MBF4180257.1 flagellar biosynthesis protein FlhA [Lelliottia nimipressuralis]MCD4562329.1 flagellar biosynthesis protein FlhA [Lelliottia nimipressuralis]PLY43246.1 flagellar biosynthesis protein FlhA [Lelliottia sp. F159]
MANSKSQQMLAILRQGRIGVPILLLSVLAMVMLPLSPLMLDILFTFNIVLAVTVLLVAVNMQRPLDFAVFPTLLLITTLMRLTLNVASTRVVLLHGHEGEGAAGKVIEAFGQVVIGGDFVVGFVVFIILMIINFVVVTKGAERISEVSARFTLDALPGKQMAIDADLNAGLINQKQARDRRKEVSKEADFYGAMDGASKFVRGDAIAGIMVLVINVIGGICIGIFKYDLDASHAFQQYVLLTIGDGLAAQIPSLLLATAAAIIVTRVSDGDDVSDEIKTQLLAKPHVLYTAAFVMFILAIVPGMPHIAFLCFTGLLLFAAWRQSKVVKPAEEETDYEAITDALGQDVAPAINWESIPLVEPIGLNLGYKLVTLIDSAKGSPLSQRIRGVRQVVSEQCGVLLPEIRIRENFRLKPAQYAIHINGIRTALAEVYAEKLMAIPGAELYGEIDGVLDTDPAYGMAIVWIDPEQKANALNLGYQVVDCASVVATHVNKVAREHLPELFNYDDITHLHARLAQQAPKLAEDLSNALNFSLLLRIYRQLLLEQVSLKDIVTIASTLLESSAVTKDPILLTSDVRYALRRAIIHNINGDRQKLAAYTIDNALENMLLGALNQSQQSGKVALDSFPVDPNILTQLQNTMPIIQEQMKAKGMPPLLLVTPQLRPLISRYGRLFASNLNVLSYNEVPDDSDLTIVGTLS